MDAQILGALIGSLTALAVAVLAWLQGRRNQRAQETAARELASLKAQLDERLAESAARRDYEYEARKRLYTEVGPLLFQLAESSDAASGEIRRLCDPAHWPRLALTDERREALTRQGWIGSTSYDTAFAAYALLAPLASYRFIQRRLTVVDLALDARVHAQWILLRALYESFWRDEEIAALVPALAYAPRVAQWRTLRRADPARHWWQGVTRGRLDNAISMIIDDDGVGPARLRTFGEFESTFREVASTGDHREKTLGAFANALFDFRPDTRPVFWRLLAVQAVLHRSLYRLTSSHGTAPTGPDLVAGVRFDDDLRQQFDVEGAEPPGVLAGVVDAYLSVYLRPGLAGAARASPGGAPHRH